MRRHRIPFAAAVVAVLALIGMVCCGSPAGRPAVFPRTPVEPAAAGKILMLASAASTQTLAQGSTRKTGTFLGELYEPYRALLGAGHQVTLATVGGAKVAIDPESLKEKYWETAEQLAAAQSFVVTSSELASPLAIELALASVEDFQGLVIPGGQGVMVDQLDNADVHALILRFSAQDRPIGLVCHAPAVLTRLKGPGRLAGREVTSVSGLEELFIETFVMGEEARVRGIGDSLEAHGYGHSAAFPGSSFAVRDCNLVTSQNPFSTGEFSRLYLQALHDFRHGARCAL
jgi:putative intracellular protease/amidase